jgi:DnaJ-class molecular chaperone
MRRRGANLEASLELDFLEAARGGEKRLQISRPTATGGHRSESVTVRIPPGVADGGQIRLRGKGGEGLGGGPAGDLIARIRVRSHPLFRRDNRDISLEVPLTIAEATLGTQVEVPTLDGRVTVTIPPGTDSGSKLRLRGKGVPDPSGGAAGDFYVTVKISVPKKLDDVAAQQLRELANDDPTNLRAELDERD